MTKKNEYVLALRVLRGTLQTVGDLFEKPAWKVLDDLDEIVLNNDNFHAYVEPEIKAGS